jgi:hypothetical protein
MIELLFAIALASAVRWTELGAAVTNVLGG